MRLGRLRGSGSFAETGWTHAAYHRDIQQYPTTGGGVQASLTASQPSPNCFTIAVAHANAPWNVERVLLVRRSGRDRLQLTRWGPEVQLRTSAAGPPVGFPPGVDHQQISRSMPLKRHTGSPRSV